MWQVPDPASLGSWFKAIECTSGGIVTPCVFPDPATPSALSNAASLDNFLALPPLESHNRRRSLAEAMQLAQSNVDFREMPMARTRYDVFDPGQVLARVWASATVAQCPAFIPTTYVPSATLKAYRSVREGNASSTAALAHGDRPESTLLGCVFIGGGGALDIWRAITGSASGGLGTVLGYRQLLLLAQYEVTASSDDAGVAPRVVGQLWHPGNHTQMAYYHYALRTPKGYWDPLPTEHVCVSWMAAAMVADGTRLYVAGGLYINPQGKDYWSPWDSVSGPTTALCVYHIDGGFWENRPELAMPEALFFSSSLILGRQLVLAVGMSAATTSVVYRFDLEALIWQVLAPDIAGSETISRGTTPYHSVPSVWTAVDRGETSFRQSSLPNMHGLDLYQPAPRINSGVVPIGSRLYFWGGYSDLVGGDLVDHAVLWTGINVVSVSQTLPTALHQLEAPGLGLMTPNISSVRKAVYDTLVEARAQDDVCLLRDTVPCGTLTGAVAMYGRADSESFVSDASVVLDVRLTSSILLGDTHISGNIQVSGEDDSIAVYCLQSQHGAWLVPPFAAGGDGSIVNTRADGTPCIDLGSESQSGPGGSSSSANSITTVVASFRRFSVIPLASHAWVRTAVSSLLPLPWSPGHPSTGVVAIAEMPFLRATYLQVAMDGLYIDRFGMAWEVLMAPHPAAAEEPISLPLPTLLGGGVTASFSTVSVSGVTMSHCIGREGGAMFALGGELFVDGCSIVHNHATISGGGIGIRLARVAVSDSILSSNAVSRGASVALARVGREEPQQLDAESLTYNVSGTIVSPGARVSVKGQGGGLACTGSLEFVVQRCTLQRNWVAASAFHSSAATFAETGRDRGGGIGATFCSTTFDGVSFGSNIAGE